MKNPEVNRVKEMLSNTYNGSAWHGASMLEILNRINAYRPFNHRITFKESVSWFNLTSTFWKN